MKSILVCDDDRDILDLVSLVLEDHFQVFTEVNSIKLIDLATSLKPDVILLDMWMPNVSGDRLAAVIKNMSELQHIPLIIFSASKDSRQKALDAGADEFLSKPFDIDYLIDLVSQYALKAA